MSDNYVRANTLCTPSKLPASDYVINPYVGCIHRCLYCYACFMGRFTGHTEKWGTYIEPKRFESYALPKDLKGKTILIGSVTDAYNPAEKKYSLMPDILKSLSKCDAHVEILTKSSLVLRDMHFIKAIPDVAVGVSMSNLSENDNALFEPGASSAKERIHTLSELHKAGIRTYLFVAPYLPGITNLSELCETVKGSVDYVCVENLNLRGSYKQPMLEAIRKSHPDIYPLWDDIYVKKHASTYWSKVEEELTLLGKEIDIPLISYMYHEKIKKQ